MRFNVIFAMAIFSLLFGTVLAIGAEYTFRPSIAVNEEYTDNVFEVMGNKREDFITRVLPGFSMKHKAPFWDWDIGYIFDYRHYARQSKGDEITHNLGIKGNLRVVGNFLLLDLSDTYRRVSLDVARDVTTESLFVNQTDQNIATVSPYLLWRPTGKGTVKTGYKYTDTRYWDSAGIDKIEHGAFADLTHELTTKLSLTAGYAYARREAVTVQFDKHDLSGGIRYEYADKSFLFGQVGNSWQSFSSGSDVSYPFWNAGVTHDFGMAVATVETRVQTTEDPLAVSTRETIYSGRIDKTLQRGGVGFSSSYSEYVNTETETRERRKLSFAGTGRYEVLPSLTGSLSGNAERFSKKTAADYPYRFTASGGLSYALKNELSLGITYTYVAYRYGLDTADGAKEINRVIVEVRKVF